MNLCRLFSTLFPLLSALKPSAKGAPQLLLHIRSLQSVSLWFHSLYLLSLSPSLRGFNILSAWQSLCINWRFCHMPPLVVTEHSVLPPSSFLAFSHSRHLFQSVSPSASLLRFLSVSLAFAVCLFPSFLSFPAASALTLPTFCACQTCQLPLLLPLFG